jgi:precorrin-6B methylase 2
VADSIREIRSALDSVARNPLHRVEANFAARAEAIEYLEFEVIDRIDGLSRSTRDSVELSSLRGEAEEVKRGLELVDCELFGRIRSEIRAGAHTRATIRELMEDAVGPGAGCAPRLCGGYGKLDVFVNGLLFPGDLPVETRAREPEMVYYQQTPARIIFELAEKAHFSEDDLFCDLGSGLGHVPILANLLTGARARGIEFEPAYCDLARSCAADLNLSNVEFLNVDARAADYSEGTVFYMYTPFSGGMLKTVMEKLEREAARRTIRLFTYGPCTPAVALEGWLERTGGSSDSNYELAAFRSL